MLGTGLLLLIQNEISVDEIDRLVKAKDVAGLTRVVTVPEGAPNPFNVIKTGGAYDVGRFGWSAVALASPDQRDRYVVVATKLTSEDVGEILLRREGTKLIYVPETERMGIRIKRHRFEVRFDPPARGVEITDDLSFGSMMGSQPNGYFVFRMSPQYKVTSITSQGKAVAWKQASGVVLADRPTVSDKNAAADRNATATYTIKYSAIVDLPQYAGSISTKEATLVNDYWYPMIARQPAPYDLEVHAPKGWLIVGQGERLDARETDTESVASFKMDLPVVYYSLSAGPYKTFGQKIGSRNYRVWSPRLTSEQMKIQTELYAPINQFYSRAFGEYPFSQWGALDSPGYGGGALEAYSYATYGGGMPEEDAHEPAHTWWGGILNNTYLGSFWNESFAVYSDGLYHRNVPIGSVEERRLAFTTQGDPDQAYNMLSIEGSGAFVGPVGSSLGYGKGAKVLAMLEQLLGMEQMIATMREWAKVDAGKAVDWADFERVALRMNPEKKLKNFFDAWLRKPGFAELRILDPRYEGGTIHFSLRFNGESFARLPLEVMVQDRSGARQFVTVDAIGPGEYSLPLKLSAKPALVSFDPWLRVLRKIESNERLDSFERAVGAMQRYTDPAHSDYLKGYRRDAIQSLPRSLENVFVVGHPATLPAMRTLCKQAGFEVQGDKLTLDGTTIDLHDGGALAVVELAGGGRCCIGLGTFKVRPNIGLAKVALFDGYGRFIRGKTEPKTSGNLVFKL